MADEYIERQKAFEAMNGLKGNCDHRFYDEALMDAKSELMALPAADVVEVRHGKWIKGRKEKLYFNDDMSGFYEFPVTCSVCKFDITDEGFYEINYCPNCGAKMDGDTK